MSCPYYFPSAADLSNNDFKSYYIFADTLEKCEKENNKDDCQTLNTNVQLCSDSMNESIQALNQAIMKLEVQNKEMKAEYLGSIKNTNISGTFFKMTRENTAIAYIQNILTLLGICYLIYKIVIILSKTTEIKSMV
jgi:uncharacterized protein